MASRPRPISPHLQIYRWQLTSVLSITHRASGVFLVLGSGVLVYWLVALAGGPEQYADAQAVLGSWFGQLCLLGWTFAAFYHLCNGLRHLGWDVGVGLDLDTTYLTGKIVIGASAGLTLLSWVIAYGI